MVSISRKNSKLQRQSSIRSMTLDVETIHEGFDDSSKQEYPLEFPPVQAPLGTLQMTSTILNHRVSWLCTVFTDHLSAAESRFLHFTEQEPVMLEQCSPLFDSRERMFRVSAMRQIRRTYDEFVDQFKDQLVQDKHVNAGDKAAARRRKLASDTFSKYNKDVKDAFSKFYKAIKGSICSRHFIDRTLCHKSVDEKLAELEVLQPRLNRQETDQREQVLDKFSEVTCGFKHMHSVKPAAKSDATRYELHDRNIEEVLLCIAGSVSALTLIEREIETLNLAVRICRLLKVAHLASNQRREMIWDLRHAIVELESQIRGANRQAARFNRHCTKMHKITHANGNPHISFYSLKHIYTARECSVVANGVTI